MPGNTETQSGDDDTPRTRLHRAWIVAAVTLVALVGAAGFRATPGVLIDPLRDEFGWPRGTIASPSRSTCCCTA